MGAVILSAVMYTKATNWKLVWRGLDRELGRYRETKTFLIIKYQTYFKRGKKKLLSIVKTTVALYRWLFGCCAIS